MGADQRALVADEHDLVVLEHLDGADQFAVAFAGPHGDDALAAAALGGEFADGGAFAVSPFAGREQETVRAGHDQGDQAVIFGQPDAAHATGGAPHGAHGRRLEARRLARVRHQENFGGGIDDGGADQDVAGFEPEGDQAACAWSREPRQRRLLHRAVGGGHEHEGVVARWRIFLLHRRLRIVVLLGDGVRRIGVVVLLLGDEVCGIGVVVLLLGDEVCGIGVRGRAGQGQNGGDSLAVVQGQEVDERPALGGARPLGDAEHPQPVHLAGVGEAQQGVVAVGGQQMFDEVLVAQARGGASGAASTLRLVDRQRLGLGVAPVGDRDHHVLFGNEILVREVELGGQYLRLALVAVAFANVLEFFVDDLFLQRLRSEDVQQSLNLGKRLRVVFDQLVLLQRRQPVQGHREDGLGLFGGQGVAAVVAQPELGAQAFRAAGVAIGSPQQRLDRSRRPAFRHEAGARLRRRPGRTDHLDHRVDVLQRHRLALQQVTLSPGPPQQVGGAPHHHFAAVADERVEHVAQVDRARLPVDQGDAVDAEHRLQLGQGVKVVEHHLAGFAAAQFDDHAQAVPVGLVAQCGDALDALFLDQFGDLLDQPRLVHLVGQLGDDDRLLAAADPFDVGLGAHEDAAATGPVCAHDAGAAVDDGAGGEIRTLDVLHEFVHRQAGLVEQGKTAVDDLGEIVRRDIGRHAHGDAGRAVDQQVGHPRGQHLRDGQGLVVVGHDVDRFLVEIDQHLGGDPLHADLGVALGRGWIAVHGTEVAVPVHQGVAHGEVLGHAHDGLVDGAVAVGVVLAHDLAHHVGGLPIGSVEGDA